MSEGPHGNKRYGIAAIPRGPESDPDGTCLRGSPEPALWRQATEADLDAVVAIQDRVHTVAPESRAVFAGKRGAFPEGVLMLVRGDEPIGYGVFHPWTLDDVPALHALPFRVPARPDCLFIHDVALLPEARRHGAGRAVTEIARVEARRMGLGWLALVSVYGTVPVWARYGFEVRATTAASALAGYGDTARYMTAEVA